MLQLNLSFDVHQTSVSYVTPKNGILFITQNLTKENAGESNVKEKEDLIRLYFITQPSHSSSRLPHTYFLKKFGDIFVYLLSY